MGWQDHLNFYSYAIKSLSTYRIRTVAIVSSLTLAIMILGSVAFLTDGLTAEAEVTAESAPDITIQFLQAGRQVPISEDIAKELEARLPGIEAVPRVWGYIYYENRIYTIMGLDLERMPSPKEINFAIESGRYLKPGDEKAVVVGYHLAEKFGLKVGDTMILYDESLSPHEFTLIGIFDVDVRLYTSDLIITSIDDAKAFFNLEEGYVTDLSIYVDDQSHIIPVARRITAEFPALRVLTREILRQALITAYGARAGFASIIWYILLMAVILIAWNHASAVSAEGRREVGVLKALGFSTTNIIEIRLLEAVILGVLSASLGVFLAIIYDVYLGAPIISDFLLGWAAVYPDFPLPFIITAKTIATLYAVSIFPLLVGSVVPAWTSAITEPDVALRGV